MSRFNLSLAILIGSMCLTGVAAGSEGSGGPAPAEPSPVENGGLVDRSAIEPPMYGPICSRDPAVRAVVKRLYREQSELRTETLAELRELSQSLGEEPDPDIRYQINQEIARLKTDLELRDVEIGLEIARLNDDAGRVADFELALDQLLNPEKYRPAPIPARERERDLTE